MSDPLDELTPDQLLSAARRIAEHLDGGHAAAVWSKASTDARYRLSAQDFAEGVERARAPFGSLAGQRQWVRVVQGKVPAGEASPGGVYGSVVFEIGLDDGRCVHERLTFRRDEDNTWRFAGYSLQLRQVAPGAAQWLGARDASAA